METGLVRKRVLHAITEARTRARERRQHLDETERAFGVFLEQVATPVVQQVASALRAEGLAFTVFTPAGGLRLAHDRGRADFIEILLDTSGSRSQVIGRISQTRGSRHVEDERPVKANTSPADLTDEDVLEFIMQALEPWLGR